MGIMEIVLPVAVCFIVTAIAGKLLIPALVKLKAGQSIKEIGPSWHMTKQGTPTMGGLMFIIGIGLTIVVLGWQRMMAGSFVHLYVYLFALVFGVIGYIDDYQKVKHHQNTGLTAPQKFILQLAAAVAFLCLMRYEGMLSPNLYIPFWNTHIVLPWIVYLVFAAFVIVGTVNAVNITDGLDGLSSSVTVPVGLFFLVMAVIWPGSPRWRPSVRSVWTTTGLRTRPGSSSSRCCAPSWRWPVSCAYRSFSTTARPTGTRWPSFGSSPTSPACSTASPAARRWRGSCWTWAGTWASTAL